MGSPPGNRRRRMAWLAIAVFTALAACSSLTAPQFSLTFKVDRFDTSMSELPSGAVEVTGREVIVTGGLETPCPSGAGEVRAGVELERPGAIVLRIRWEPAGPCQPGTDAFAYEATMRNVRAGTYRLTVIHLFPGEAEVVTLEQDITVL